MESTRGTKLVEQDRAAAEKAMEAASRTVTQLQQARTSKQSIPVLYSGPKDELARAGRAIDEALEIAQTILLAAELDFQKASAALEGAAARQAAEPPEMKFVKEEIREEIRREAERLDGRVTEIAIAGAGVAATFQSPTATWSVSYGEDW